MKIIVISFGKTTSKPLAELENEYLKKNSKYSDIELSVIKEPSGHTKSSKAEQIRDEALLFEKKILQGDLLVVLDEKGKQLDSIQFSSMIQKTMNSSYKRLVFIIGGPYGISETIKSKADKVISLSAMTYTHEMARVIILEQIYRAFNIINNTPYHHI